MILQEGGRVAANRSIQVSPTETAPHMLMSNLEPRHTYFIQVTKAYLVSLVSFLGPLF